MMEENALIKDETRTGLSSNASSTFAVDKLITSFAVDSLVDKKIIVNQISQDETITSITLFMAEGTDVTSLTPVITLAPGATITPRVSGSQDFSQQVTYTVTAQDGTTAIYLVSAYVQQELTRGYVAIYLQSGPNGTTNPDPKWYIWDTDVPFCAIGIPDNGYMFDAWYIGGIRTSTNPSVCDYIPVDISLLATFKLIPPTISGSSPICSGASKSFTATNWQNGVYSWASSSNLSLSSTSTASITVTGTYNNGAGWVRVMSGSTILAQYNLWVGSPTLPTYVIGEQSPCLYTTYSYTTYNAPIGLGASFSWSVTPGSFGLDWSLVPFSTMADVGFSTAGYYAIMATATNVCGSSSPYPVAVTAARCRGGSDIIVYPNPVDDILYIVFDTTSSGIGQQGARPTYDIRLFNNMGTMERQQTASGGTVQINVSNLPNGMYYLVIDDGSGSTPFRQQVIVKH